MPTAHHLVCGSRLKDRYLGGLEVSYTVVFLPVLAGNKFNTDHVTGLHSTVRGF